SPQIVDEAGAVRYFVGLDAQVFDHDLLHALCDVAHRCIPRLTLSVGLSKLLVLASTRRYAHPEPARAPPPKPRWGRMHPHGSEFILRLGTQITGSLTHFTRLDQRPSRQRGGRPRRLFRAKSLPNRHSRGASGPSCN